MKFQLDEGEHIIKKGLAQYMTNAILKNEGSLYLTNRRIRFEDLANDDFSYPLGEIIEVKFHSTWGFIPAGIIIEFIDGRRVQLIPMRGGAISTWAGGREEWVNEIMKAKRQYGPGLRVERTADGSVLDSQMIGLRKNLTNYFSESEIRTLCFDCGIDYDNLAGGTKEAKARELVIACQKSGRLDRLVRQCRALRPEVAW
jgi:Effector-associated domain 7/GRAM domain